VKRKARRRSSPLLTVLVVIVVLAGLVALFNWVVMPLVVGHGRVVIVPDVVGLNRFVAESTLNHVGLRLTEVRTVPDAAVKTDFVVAQSPAPGTRVKPGRAVRLDVSRGAGRTRVPHVAGLTIEKATLVVEEAGLVFGGVESLRTQNVPAGQVIATVPPGGTELREGETVVLQISSRVGRFPMPNLVGMNVETAQGLVISQGLVLGEVRNAPSDEPPGMIMVQYPEEGSPVKAGDTVGLIVAQHRP
jgi:serine/threonine-protein kinase